MIKCFAAIQNPSPSVHFVTTQELGISLHNVSWSHWKGQPLQRGSQPAQVSTPSPWHWSCVCPHVRACVLTDPERTQLTPGIIIKGVLFQPQKNISSLSIIYMIILNTVPLCFFSWRLAIRVLEQLQASELVWTRVSSIIQTQGYNNFLSLGPLLDLAVPCFWSP